MPCKCLRRARALREVSIDDLNGDEGKAMSTETRMAIQQSTPMPQRSESGASVRYETKVLSHWDRQAWAEVNAAGKIILALAACRENQAALAENVVAGIDRAVSG